MTSTAEIVERLRNDVCFFSGLDWQDHVRLAREAADHMESLARERDKAVAALAELKWQSVDRDNMEFAARITCWQMDRIRAVLSDIDTETEGEG